MGLLTKPRPISLDRGPSNKATAVLARQWAPTYDGISTEATIEVGLPSATVTAWRRWLQGLQWLADTIVEVGLPSAMVTAHARRWRRLA